MGNRLQLTVTIVGLLLVAGRSFCTIADESPAGDVDQEKTKANKELVEKGVDDVKVFLEGEAETPLKSEIVLRWQNPVRVYTGAAVMAIWPHNGRPEAIASVYIWGDALCHEIGSLSRVGKVTTLHKTGGRSLLRDPGVNFKTVPDAPAPADTPTARLRQMKSIAERFTTKLTQNTNNNENTEVLRLLAKPLYRYEIKETQNTSLKLLDGGLFAYVTGTDPEVILLLEAVGSQDKSVWEYAFAVTTTHAVEARLDDVRVWSRSSFGSDGTNSEILLRRPLTN